MCRTRNFSSQHRSTIITKSNTYFLLGADLVDTPSDSCGIMESSEEQMELENESSTDVTLIVYSVGIAFSALALIYLVARDCFCVSKEDRVQQGESLSDKRERERQEALAKLPANASSTTTPRQLRRGVRPLRTLGRGMSFKTKKNKSKMSKAPNEGNGDIRDTTTSESFSTSSLPLRHNKPDQQGGNSTSKDDESKRETTTKRQSPREPKRGVKKSFSSDDATMLGIPNGNGAVKSSNNRRSSESSSSLSQTPKSSPKRGVKSTKSFDGYNRFKQPSKSTVVRNKGASRYSFSVRDSSSCTLQYSTDTPKSKSNKQMGEGGRPKSIDSTGLVTSV